MTEQVNCGCRKDECEELVKTLKPMCTIVYHVVYCVINKYMSYNVFSYTIFGCHSMLFVQSAFSQSIEDRLDIRNIFRKYIDVIDMMAIMLSCFHGARHLFVSTKQTQAHRGRIDSLVNLRKMRGVLHGFILGTHINYIELNALG